MAEQGINYEATYRSKLLGRRVELVLGVPLANPSEATAHFYFVSSYGSALSNNILTSDLEEFVSLLTTIRSRLSMLESKPKDASVHLLKAESGNIQMTCAYHKKHSSVINFGGLILPPGRYDALQGELDEFLSRVATWREGAIAKALAPKIG